MTHCEKNYNDMWDAEANFEYFQTLNKVFEAPYESKSAEQNEAIMKKYTGKGNGLYTILCDKCLNEGKGAF